jgi:hypothetical protein
MSTNKRLAILIFLSSNIQRKNACRLAGILVDALMGRRSAMTMMDDGMAKEEGSKKMRAEPAENVCT